MAAVAPVITTARQRLTAALDSPNVMTRRARVYMLLVAATNLALGFFCVVAPETFISSSFAGIKDALGVFSPDTALRIWGGGFLTTTVVCLWSVGSGRDNIARAGLLFSVAMTGFWASGFIASALMGELAGPTGPIVWLGMIGRDFVMLSNPMRAPLEWLVERLLARRG